MVNVYKGAIHIHSKYSDGRQTVEEIAAEAKRAGLSWILITDHNTLATLQNNQEGWYHGVAVLAGEEITPDISNHYLAFGINQTVSHEQPPEDYIKKVKELGGFGFIAHPDEKIGRKNNFRPLRWQDWNIQGFDGLEIWNFLSDWVDNFDTKDVLRCYFRKNHILSGPSKNVLKWWDELNNANKNIVPAIGGVDAHALRRKYYGIRVLIFPYYQSFKTVTNHIYLDKELPSDFNEAKNQIFSAIKNGQNTIMNCHWHSPKSEFSYYVENKETRTYPGGTTQLNNDSKLIIKTPKKATIRLIYNGEPIQETHNNQLVMYFDLKEGKYRVEVYYKNHPWIFTNPISIV